MRVKEATTNDRSVTETGRCPLRGEGQWRVGIRSSRQNLEAVGTLAFTFVPLSNSMGKRCADSALVK